MKVTGRLFTLGAALILTASAVFAQDMRIDLGGSLAWDRMELNARAALNLVSTDIKLPTGRLIAEELINTEFPRLIQPSLLSLPVDSANTIEDLILRGEYSLHGIGNLALSAKRFPSAFSPDMALIYTEYTIDLKTLSKSLIHHRSNADIPRTMMPVSSASYTGIIIIASGEYPIHGRNTKSRITPCLFPRIWDSEMNLVYQRNMVNPEQARDNGIVRYTEESRVFQPTPSGLDRDISDLVGDRPLRILAREVFGKHTTDPVIDRADALLIISSEENRRLLREGRVVIVLDSISLKHPLNAAQ